MPRLLNLFIGLSLQVFVIAFLFTYLSTFNIAYFHFRTLLSLNIATAATIYYNFDKLLLWLRHNEAEAIFYNIIKNTKLYSFFLILCIIIFMFSLYQLPIEVILKIFLTSPLVVVYSLPIFKSKKKWIAIRQIGWLKPIWVAIFWVIVTYQLWNPLLFTPYNTGLFMLCFANMLLFDLNNVKIDALNKISTLSYLLGAKNTLIMATITHLLGCFLLNLCANQLYISIAIGTTGIVYVLFIYSRLSGLKYTKFALINDGVLIIYAILLLFDQLNYGRISASHFKIW